ncbi:DUF456 domain-containing protein [Priestia koreensis]|uniref:DUF456 domain-containing protein n=1 Tax=Priestia koreensis TaxID=284581 RepID=A0A0M0KZ48_9BACI|nr:DUF456 domain-containing protein [Priestia koreensis]KOO43902.1 hypothetical protein AMD01_14290 [Priestia koreensis]
MDILYWILISVSFLIAFVGLVYPIIPSVLFVAIGFILYGLFYGFASYSVVFWFVQGFLTIALFLADYLANLVGVKKYGGTKAGVWGSTVGLLVGPFIIPIVGIVIGPFVGAVLAELIFKRRSLKEAFMVGIGSLIGFFSGVLTKGLIQLFMVGYFLYAVLK